MGRSLSGLKFLPLWPKLVYAKILGATILFSALNYLTFTAQSTPLPPGSLSVVIPCAIQSLNT